MAADAPNRFRPGRYGAVPAPPTADEWSKLSDFEKDQKRGQEWLKRSYGWEINAQISRNEAKWVGERLLGKGCAVLKQGYYDKGRYRYKRIVVKQASSPEAKALLENGAYIIKRLRKEIPGHVAEHIVLPVRDYTEDVDTGTDDTFDPVYVHEFAPDTVARSYMLYYEGGNFQQWLEENFGSEYPSENDIWSVMECLARICMNLEYGDETRSKVDGAKVFQPIVHLDIRPQSIFCCHSDVCKNGQHANRTKFLLGKFEKAVNVPSDPTDEKWMFRVHGRADPNWAAPEQKYPQMEGRSISSSCNIFGIGALLYYMIKGKEIDDRAWRIGMPGSVADQEFKLYFGGDLITEPVAEQQEYSKALIRVILKCLAYLPSDRITAAELRNISAQATDVSSRQWLESETQYNPGDPATIFEPQEELQPNDYTVADLSLKDKISMYSPPRDYRETLRARAEKWLSNFWLFPDSVKSQEAREKQRLAYERQVEKQRQEAAAAEAKKQAEAQTLADLSAELRLMEEQEEAARIARVERIAQLRAEAARKISAIRGEGQEQILLPQPNNKRDRSPEPPQRAVRKKVRFGPLPESSKQVTPVAQGSGSQVMDVGIEQDRTILPPRDKGKGKEIVAVPPGIPPVSNVPAPAASGVSAEAGPAPSIPAPLPKPPTASGVSAQAGPAPSEPTPSRPTPSGPAPLPKPPTASGNTAQAGLDQISRDREERRKRSLAIYKEAEEEEKKKRKEQFLKEREDSHREAVEQNRMMNRNYGWGKSTAEARKESSKLIAPPLGGASRPLSSNADTPSMRRSRESPPGLTTHAATVIQDDTDDDPDDDDDVEEVAPTGSRARSPPRPVSPIGSPPYRRSSSPIGHPPYPRPVSPIGHPPYRPASPVGVPIGMKSNKPILYCFICGRRYQLRSACEAHIKQYHKRRRGQPVGKPVEQPPANPEEDPVGKSGKGRKAVAKGGKGPTLKEARDFFGPGFDEA